MITKVTCSSAHLRPEIQERVYCDTVTGILAVGHSRSGKDFNVWCIKLQSICCSIEVKVCLNVYLVNCIQNCSDLISHDRWLTATDTAVESGVGGYSQATHCALGGLSPRLQS